MVGERERGGKASFEGTRVSFRPLPREKVTVCATCSVAGFQLCSEKVEWSTKDPSFRSTILLGLLFYENQSRRDGSSSRSPSHPSVCCFTSPFARRLRGRKILHMSINIRTIHPRLHDGSRPTQELNVRETMLETTRRKTEGQLFLRHKEVI